MGYALEAAAKEFDRLEKQSQHPNYDFRMELADLQVPPHAKILDAGCGSGVVSRYLAQTYPQAHITGCDFSSGRLELARQAGANTVNLHFQVEDLTRLSIPDHTFDLVVCRFVLQHISHQARTQALSELTRVLKPGGKIHLIDVDGFIVNLYPRPPTVEIALKKLSQTDSVDFHIGRKLPYLLKEAGLSKIQHRTEALHNCPDSIEGEIQAMKERFENAFPFISKTLGGNEAAQSFIDAYITAMRETGAVYFFTKFIVEGTKVGGQVSLIKRVKS